MQSRSLEKLALRYCLYLKHKIRWILFEKLRSAGVYSQLTNHTGHQVRHANHARKHEHIETKQSQVIAIQ